MLKTGPSVSHPDGATSEAYDRLGNHADLAIGESKGDRAEAAKTARLMMAHASAPATRRRFRRIEAKASIARQLDGSSTMSDARASRTFRRLFWLRLDS